MLGVVAHVLLVYVLIQVVTVKLRSLQVVVIVYRLRRQLSRFPAGCLAFIFLPRDAMLARYMSWSCVYLSVCHKSVFY